MNNIINNWSYDKPTEPGDYLCCWGDVETQANVFHAEFRVVRGQLEDRNGHLLSDYTENHKYARLVYSPTEIKEIEG